jgi:hypothetical protein
VFLPDPTKQDSRYPVIERRRKKARFIAILFYDIICINHHHERTIPYYRK